MPANERHRGAPAAWESYLAFSTIPWTTLAPFPLPPRSSLSQESTTAAITAMDLVVRADNELPGSYERVQETRLPRLH